MKKIGIIMGSDSDLPIVGKEVLNESSTTLCKHIWETE